MQDLILSLINSYGIYAIFFLMISNGFASTPPSEAVYGFAGVLAYYGHINLYYVLLFGVAGNLTGTLLLYLVGVKIGCEWLLNLKIRLASLNKIFQKISSWLPNRKFIYRFEKLFTTKNGFIYVGVFRCFPLIRSIVSLPAGMVKMPIHKFLIYSFIGCAIWGFLWLELGYFLGESWQNWSFLVTAILLVILSIMILYLKHRVKKAYLDDYK